MKKVFVLLLIIMVTKIKAQELFVYTEPASNMAAKSMGIRLNNHFMNEVHANAASYHLMPEVMIGISKKIMVHGAAFMSNGSNQFKLNGGSFYLKYRFFSQDDIHNHFRMAAFAKAATNNSFIHKRAIDITTQNSGYGGGIVATKLIHKLAISASTSYLHATDNGNYKFVYGVKNRNAINYSLSTGLLAIPKEYTDYNQPNINVMVELLGQVIPNSGYRHLDIAPSIQLILKSRTRIDLAYRYNITENLSGLSESGFLLRFEYNFFNLFK